VLSDLAVVHALLGLFTLAAVYAVNRLPGWYAVMLAGRAPAGIAGTVALDVLILFGLLVLPVLCAGAVLPAGRPYRARWCPGSTAAGRSRGRSLRSTSGSPPCPWHRRALVRAGRLW